MFDLLAFQKLLDFLIRESGAEQRALHQVVATIRLAGVFQQIEVSEQRRPERPPRIASRRRNPDVVKYPLAQQHAVGDAIQSHAAGEAKIFCAGDLFRMARHPQHDFLGDFLDRSGQVHFALCDHGFRMARRPAEQVIEVRAGHRQALAIVEIPHVHRQGTVWLQVNKLFENNIHILRLAIGSEAHELVFAGIDAEAAEVSECAVE